MLRKIIALIKKVLSNSGLYYIGSSDKLPEPLSKEEEVKYVLKSMEGDEQARAKLIEHNLRLVVFLAKKYENTGVDLEDLVSIGTIGLIKGVGTYKLDKNIKLATYASRCIDNEILMFLRKNKKRRGEVSFEDSLSFDDEDDIVTKGLEKETEKKLLYQEIEKLSGRDKQIMILRYGLYNQPEMTQKDVANLLNISQSYISRIEKKIIRRLKNIVKL